jgi:3-dehydroquinate synthase
VASERINVKSQFGDYDVISVSTFPEMVQCLSGFDFRGILIDKAVMNSFSTELSLPDAPTYALEVAEEAKQYRQLEDVYLWMANSGFDRRSPLLVIGGGTTQDIATFVTATYHRGVPWVFIPTTLLSQSDSCIGGKCGINLRGFKNQIGLVNPPDLIVAQSQFLRRLSIEDLVSGLGEILKIAVTGQNQFWEQYQALTEASDPKNFDYQRLIMLALNAKKYVIEIDEMENDYRRVLNYGHTIGHAIEAASDFRISHGIGVLLGIKVISRLGERWGITPPGLASDVIGCADHLLAHSTSPRDFSVTDAISMLKHDKKTLNGQITFVVLAEPGHHIFVQKSLNEVLVSELAEELEKL